MFYIGVVIFSLILLVEHLFSIKTDITCFVKVFGCSLQLEGAIILIIKKNRK